MHIAIFEPLYAPSPSRHSEPTARARRSARPAVGPRHRHAAGGWRFDVPTYLDAVRGRPGGTRALAGAPRSLRDTIRAVGVDGFEEDIIEDLVTDLRLAPASRP